MCPALKSLGQHEGVPAPDTAGGLGAAMPVTPEEAARIQCNQAIHLRHGAAQPQDTLEC